MILDVLYMAGASSLLVIVWSHLGGRGQQAEAGQKASQKRKLEKQSLMLFRQLKRTIYANGAAGRHSDLEVSNR